MKINKNKVYSDPLDEFMNIPWSKKPKKLKNETRKSVTTKETNLILIFVGIPVAI